MADYVKFEVPDAIMQEQLAFLEKAGKKGKIRIGINEVTKAIERNTAKLVLIAMDVDPAEVVMHLPLLCDEKQVPYSFVKTKKELGNKAGIHVGTASVAVTEEGDAKKELLELVKKLAEIKK